MGDPRIILLRDVIVTAFMGFLFLATLIPLETRWFTMRPTVLLVGRQLFRPSQISLDRSRGSETRNARIRMVMTGFRWSMYGLTASWGVLLILECVATLIMVYAAPSLSMRVGWKWAEENDYTDKN
ncbi:hypothetical protein BDB00DRAFT_876346 [Zychaea mexicana]|uniref:uncharacterized protein n=1 Tax=Zychaea mexicana TaxID=64656 RepID=UPI0022FE19EF|nr:uncharacterized protein BDB00DRAFT_876346 [Zychaea mexicana]KAI9489471.1 hypothetical protein BDB00DRAFT_876346 [Zychaea mexicana]